MTTPDLPTARWADSDWYTLSEDLVRQTVRAKLHQLEAAKMNVMLELAEAKAVYAVAPVEEKAPASNSDPRWRRSAPPEPVNLGTHIANLQAQVDEYDLRISAVLALLPASQVEESEPPEETRS